MWWSNPALNIRLVVRVVLSWVIPFIGSFAFFRTNNDTRELELSLEKNDMKNLLTAFAANLWAYLAADLVAWDRWQSIALTYGLFIFGNVLLDVLILLPLSQMALWSEYVVEIGALYVIFAVTQSWFGFQIARTARPQQNLWFGVVLRSALPSITSYVAISLLFDERQTDLLLPVWHFRTAMVALANVTIAFNLAKACQGVRDLEIFAFPVTMFFIVTTVGLDFVTICPVFHWSFAKYMAERGFRLLTTTSLAIIARDSAKRFRDVERVAARNM